MDVTQSGDCLALAVLRGMTENTEYAWKEREPLPNGLYIRIK